MHRFAVSFFVLVIPIFAAERWEMQYFHDENKSTLSLNDIKFCSAQRGVAVGMLVEDRGRRKPVALVTSNGGQTWSTVELKQPALSLFFLNETAGWMVTAGGIWFTDEAGRSWRRIKKEEGLERVYFLTAEHGFAIGRAKRVLETKDAGKTWKAVAAAEELKTRPERTTFHAVAFKDEKVGIIVGQSLARRNDSRHPLWMDPEPKERRELPSLSVFLETKNAGETWTQNSSSMFGRFSQIRIGPDGLGLALLEFDYFFDYPSEVFSLNLHTGKTTRVLRRADFAVTDIARLPWSGPSYAAGYQPTGALFHTPIPGKLKIAESTDLNTWREMQVDYRAVANRVSMAVWDKDHMWVATDTGMVLRLRRD